MHTITMTLSGLFLLALMLGAAKMGLSSSWTLGRAAAVFIPLWSVIAIGNMLVGMFSAGIPFLIELAVLVAVLGIPVAVAYVVKQRAGV